MKQKFYSLITLVFCCTLAFAQTTTKARVKIANNETIISAPVSQEPYAFPLPKIAEKDISWERAIWRTIDVTQLASAEANNLSDILTEGISNGTIKAYGPMDDHFTKEMSRGELADAIKIHTTKFRVKEYWVFVPKENKMLVRIVGIAPVDENENPSFWVFYPQASELLAQHKVTSLNNESKSWDELLFLTQNKG